MVEQTSSFTPSRISPAELESRVSRSGITRPAERGKDNFAEILHTKVDGSLRFSAHAEARLRARDIELSEQDKADLSRAVEMAGQKGARESLILLDDLALIVSVRNRTVITALERAAEEPNVFTHIDSAVVLPRLGPQEA